jgi:hypothetical protein
MTNRVPKKYRDIFSDSYDGPYYKYRPAVAKFDKEKQPYNEYTERIITTQSLFHQDPRKFNDPFEFVPYVKPMSRQALKRMLNSKGVPKSTKEVTINQYNEKSKQFQDHLKTNLDQVIDDSHYGVCCFSKRWDIIQMWSYYADDHTGICFGFHTNYDSGLEKNRMWIKEVSYQMERPSFTLGTNSTNWDFLFTKESKWEHEQEVRRVDIDMTSAVSRNRRYNKQDLRELIFGCNVSELTIDHYSNLLSEHGFNHIQLKRAVKNDKYYKLDIVDL